MSSGELKAALAPDATPEQIKEWRAANGVPEDPNDYLKGLPSGYVVGDDDRALLGDFAKYMHDTNAPTPVVQKAAEWYFKFAEKQAAEDAQKAAVFRRGAEDTLRAEWQKDYHENLNRGGEVLTQYFPEDIRETITNARLPDGTMLGDHPSFAKALATISREMNPAYTMAPGISGTTGGTLGDEIARIGKLMATPGSEYWRGETGAKTQERYRQLVDARSRQQARSGVAA